MYQWPKCQYPYFPQVLEFNFRVLSPCEYLKHGWVLVMEKQNSNQKCEGWKGGGIYQNFWPLPPQVYLWSLFQHSVKTVKGFESGNLDQKLIMALLIMAISALCYLKNFQF